MGAAREEHARLLPQGVGRHDWAPMSTFEVPLTCPKHRGQIHRDGFDYVPLPITCGPAASELFGKQPLPIVLTQLSRETEGISALRTPLHGRRFLGDRD